MTNVRQGDYGGHLYTAPRAGPLGSKTNVMATMINPAVQHSYAYPREKTSLLQRFAAWTRGQQENRFLWLALALGGHGCVLTPLTILLVVALTGMNLVLFMTGAGCDGYGAGGKPGGFAYKDHHPRTFCECAD